MQMKMSRLALLAIASFSVDATSLGLRDGSCRGGDAAGESVLLQSSAHLRPGLLETASASSCDEASWPDKDNGIVCGECKVLVDRFSSFYRTCSGYCASIGRQCTGAWEEQNDDCAVKAAMTCDETVASSDALCECGDEATAGCYGEMPELVVDEGSTVGERIDTSSAAECKASCDASAACQSFSLSPTWGCYMKDRTLSGGEDTKAFEDYVTYYKRPCGGTSPTAAPSAAPTAGEACYGELAELAVDEGNEVGKVETSSAAECQRACDANPACQSFSLSSDLGCYLKDRSFSGREATKAHYDFRTYYKKPCDGTASLEPTPSPTAAPSAETCYGELAELAVDEGNEVGKVETSSAAECQRACDADPACQSFSLSSDLGCYLKDRTFVGCETTRSYYDFRTYYKKQCGSALCTPAPTPAPTPYPPGIAPIPGYDLIWNDEFGSWDSSKWEVQQWNSGLVNQELQAYTDEPGNSYVRDGALHIVARRTRYANRRRVWEPPSLMEDTAQYTSARLVSKLPSGSFRYGRFEIRAQLPVGDGTWPALWMLHTAETYGRWPDSGEIDIMEHTLCYGPGEVKATVHTNAKNARKRNNPVGSWTLDPSVFHVYGLDWTPDELKITVDGNEFFRYTRSGRWQDWPFDQPFRLILNVAVGGGFYAACPGFDRDLRCSETYKAGGCRRVWNTNANGHTCGDRIKFVKDRDGISWAEAERSVGNEQLACRPCAECQKMIVDWVRVYKQKP